jgi:hypothetical protein
MSVIFRLTCATCNGKVRWHEYKRVYVHSDGTAGHVVFQVNSERL